MKTFTVRELRHHFGRVSRWIDRGEQVIITKRRKAVAKLVPIASQKINLEWPDFEKRLKKIFPRGAKGKLLSEVIDEQRGE